jgi:2-dehydro-3-deoxy-D-arabinonate dehydratase
VIVYRTTDGLVVEDRGKVYEVDELLDTLIARADVHAFLEQQVRSGYSSGPLDKSKLLAPVGSQEVWAAGVTYLRSRAARMAESKDAGGGDFYDRVYSAERPELFFKSQPHKVVGPGAAVGLRSDATWSVPEPELALLMNPRGQVIGYTIGNDMSSRDIEGQNPLYLPQAKVYNRSCALGPGILMTQQPLPKTTRITIEIGRAKQVVFSGETFLSQIKRPFEDLVAYLFRDQQFPFGCFLLTGTGIVPPDSFTLEKGDTVRIGIDGIGELVNPVN